jgi:molecular chaperone DnaJ
LFRSECFHCDGTGFEIKNSCKTCSGDGLLTIDDGIRVQIPAGVATGQKLKVKTKGNASRNGGPNGDLYVIVNVSDHAIFRRRGADVIVELPLPYPELVLGAEVTVPTLDGSTTIRVPPGTPPGRIFRLTGRGLLQLGRPGRGDLHYQVTLEVPTELSSKERAALRAWADSLPSHRHPAHAEFDRAVQER